MTALQTLLSRQRHHIITFDFQGTEYTVRFSFFPIGSLAETSCIPANRDLTLMLRTHDTAIVASIALQHGVPFAMLRQALLRCDDGAAAGPLACAIDLIDAEHS